MTAGTNGIPLEISRRLAKNGAKVIGISIEDRKTLVKQLRDDEHQVGCFSWYF